MSEIKIKRVYEDYSTLDGFRVLVDRLWPRGVKKESLKFDLWEKNIAPSSQLRKWVHTDSDKRWDEFTQLYIRELSCTNSLDQFVELIKQYSTVTLLYAARDTQQNHALVLKSEIEKKLGSL